MTALSAIVIALATIAAFWLRQERTWGYALAVIVNAKGAAYTLSLSRSLRDDAGAQRAALMVNGEKQPAK